MQYLRSLVELEFLVVIYLICDIACSLLRKNCNKMKAKFGSVLE